ncbi:hydrogenase expression/formation protein HypE [Thermosphaera chiliense]|uniref:Hydrogenase expression/formation protein HypE n=1 Tax=Thermosphaera chiliense TaxID=3402707 RepID=A0A7M1UT53_9CREN|nr:hydrogenase expression/formation protein HypE [Thermosphaera aggregans]QOR93924.1 hydrogenase expression/formation protein HypE [Thermosphaera aggregans]
MEAFITLLHGAGGQESHDLIESLIVKKVPLILRYALDGRGLDILDDGSFIKIGDTYVVFSSDSYTVKPLFYPGGNIGELAASGVLNDLVMMGARPVAFLDNIIVEEGFPVKDLEEIINSLVRVLKENNVSLIGGDFKVMPKGTLDKIVISGFGIGVSLEAPIVDQPHPGDVIIVTNNIAEHGAAILASQLGMDAENLSLRSDSKPLVKTVLPVIEKYRNHVHAARDPTRGGISSILNEWVRNKEVSIIVDESKIPIREDVKTFLEMLGIDPLTVASEGVAVLSVSRDVSNEIMEALKSMGENPQVIGEVIIPDENSYKGKVLGFTEVGGRRVIKGEALNLPRIC